MAIPVAANAIAPIRPPGRAARARWQALTAAEFKQTTGKMKTFQVSKKHSLFTPPEQYFSVTNGQPDLVCLSNTGVLVPVRLLINDTSIEQVKRPMVTYYHVELPRHDVLFAEGLPVESYLDVGDRANFANAGGATNLFADST